MNETKTENQINTSIDEMSFKSKLSEFLFKPGMFFSHLSGASLKFSTWFLPLLIMIILYFVIRYMPIYSNNVKASYNDMVITNYTNRLNAEVAAGRLVKDTADFRLNDYKSNLDKYAFMGGYMMSMNNFWVNTALFFLITGVLFIFFRFIMREKIDYKMVLSVYGMAYYVIVIKYLLLFLFIFISGQWISGTNLNPFGVYSRMTPYGFFLEKCDPFLIWFYIMLGIGFAKAFGKPNTLKYVLIMLGLWIVTHVIFFLLVTWNINFRFFNFY